MTVIVVGGWLTVGAMGVVIVCWVVAEATETAGAVDVDGLVGVERAAESDLSRVGWED